MAHARPRSNSARSINDFTEMGYAYSSLIEAPRTRPMLYDPKKVARLTFSEIPILRAASLRLFTMFGMRNRDQACPLSGGLKRLSTERYRTL